MSAQRHKRALEAVCYRNIDASDRHAFTEGSCRTSVYVCVGERAGHGITAKLLTKLAQLFDTAAAEGPVQNIIPLLPSVGWSSGALGPSPHQLIHYSKHMETAELVCCSPIAGCCCIEATRQPMQ